MLARCERSDLQYPRDHPGTFWVCGEEVAGAASRVGELGQTIALGRLALGARVSGE
jgi:hypothetical protein